MREPTGLGALPPRMSAADDAEALDLGQIWRALLRRLPMILAVTLLAFAASFVAVNSVSPRYTGEAKLFLETRDTFYTRPGTDRESAAQTIDPEAVQSQVQLIMSRDLAREAIKRLGLIGNSEFDNAIGPFDVFQPIMLMIGLGQTHVAVSAQDRVLEKYYDRLLVYPVGKSRVVAIEFASRDPDLAARAANTIAGLYLDQQEAAKKDTARSASTWLANAIDPLREQVAEAESKVETFRARTGLLIGTNNTTITSQQLAELSTQLGAARNAQADSQAKAALIRDLIKSGRVGEIPEVAKDELIRRLSEQRVTLRGQIALETRTLLPAHPRIKELNAQLADLDAQVRAASDRTVRTLENDAKVAGARVESLQAALAAQKTVAAEANESEVQLRALERDARTKREQLESYLVKFREAVARDAENAAPADARVVSRAIALSLPSFPKKVPIVILATMAAMVLSASFVVAKELLTGRPVPAHAATTVALPAVSTGAQTGSGSGVRYETPPAWSAGATLQPGKRWPLALAAAAEGPAPPADEAAQSAAAPAGALETGAPKPDVASKSEIAVSSDGGGAPLPVAPRPRRAKPRVAATGDHPRSPSARTEAEADTIRDIVRRLPPPRGGGTGRRLLVTETAPACGAAALARQLAGHFSQSGRAIFIPLVDDTSIPGKLGFTDLVTGQASFAEIIDRAAGSRLHVMGPGTQTPGLMTGTLGTVELAFLALDQTYDWTVFLLPAGEKPELVAALAARVDAVILSAHEAERDGAALAAYDALLEAGASQVVVALHPAVGDRTAAA